MLSSSPVRVTKLADIFLALTLVPEGCYELFQFRAALLRALQWLGIAVRQYLLALLSPALIPCSVSHWVFPRCFTFSFQ